MSDLLSPRNTCTWKGCNENAQHPQVSSDNQIWANLCDSHSQELEQAISDLNPKTLLRAWILAQGGAEQAAKRS